MYAEGRLEIHLHGQWRPGAVVRCGARCGRVADLVGSHAEVAAGLRDAAIAVCQCPGAREALDGDRLRTFEFQARPLVRIYQLDRSRGVTGFPAEPKDVVQPEH